MNTHLNFLTAHSISKLQKVNLRIGNTPLFEITKMYKKKNIRIFAKLEWEQLGGSIKVRPAYNIMRNALITGQLQINGSTHLIDATSGNTGIAYAEIGRALNIPVTLCMPETASIERKNILKNLGAHIVLTDGNWGSDFAQKTAKNMYEENKDKFFFANQYDNDNNWKAHYDHTANEIWRQTNGRITHFVAGIGTSGTITGMSRRFKELNPNMQVIGLQPDNANHCVEGWKHYETAKRIPAISKLNQMNKAVVLDTTETADIIKKAAQIEGLMLSPSAATNLLGAIKIAEEIDSGIIVTTFADNADKYSAVMRKVFGRTHGGLGFI